MPPTAEHSDEDIQRAMATVARVIELYGEAYWPILDRLERELEMRRAKAARLSRHLARFDQHRRALLPREKTAPLRVEPKSTPQPQRRV